MLLRHNVLRGKVQHRQLRAAVEKRDNGNLDGVFLWTGGSCDGDGEKTAQILNVGMDAHRVWLCVC